MRCLTAATALFLFLAAGLSSASADDFGPRRDVGTVRADAQRLLAHRARLAKVDPKQIVISDVVVVNDQAVLSWDIAKDHGLMGLVRKNNRWWDALDATRWDASGAAWTKLVRPPLNSNEPDEDQCAKPYDKELIRWGFTASFIAAVDGHNTDVSISRASPSPTTGKAVLVKPRCDVAFYDLPDRVPIDPAGGVPRLMKDQAQPYQLTLRFAKNNATPAAKLSRVYARPPTTAEFLPYPTPYRYVSDAVMFFDITIDGPKPVTFQKGTTFDVWFPFVLDDTLKYRLSFSGGQEPVGPIVGSIFDNVVHFELPAFTALPGKELMGEIDGDVH